MDKTINELVQRYTHYLMIYAKKKLMERFSYENESKTKAGVASFGSYAFVIYLEKPFSKID